MNKIDRGPWILTAPSGGRFYLADPAADEMNIEDVANALSRICRYGGHLNAELDGIYSVAQHSVYVERILAAAVTTGVDAEARPAALLHDAAETWYGDTVSPLKSLTPAVEAYETTALLRFYDKLGVMYNEHIRKLVKWADFTMAIVESYAITPCSAANWEPPYPLPFPMTDVDPHFELWSPHRARDEYLKAFDSLGLSRQ